MLEYILLIQHADQMMAHVMMLEKHGQKNRRIHALYINARKKNWDTCPK
jgi:hypothetical protein